MFRAIYNSILERCFELVPSKLGLVYKMFEMGLYRKQQKPVRRSFFERIFHQFKKWIQTFFKASFFVFSCNLWSSSSLKYGSISSNAFPLCRYNIVCYCRTVYYYSSWPFPVSFNQSINEKIKYLKCNLHYGFKKNLQHTSKILFGFGRMFPLNIFV